MTSRKHHSSHLAEPADVVKALDDMILYADRTGAITDTRGASLEYLPKTSEKSPFFWTALALGTQSLKETLRVLPPFQIHEISCCDGNSFLLRIIPLHDGLSHEHGYVLIVTDNRPMEMLHEAYEERLEDNITAWADSITLFNAFFDMAKDATFLMDKSGIILAANTSAQKQHARSEQRLTGKRCEALLGKRFHASLRNAMHTLHAKELWTKNVVAVDGDGEGFPVEATLRKIEFSDYILFQLILHDLTEHTELKEHLQEKRAEVKEKDIALRQVIRSVEEDRKAMQEKLIDQVKKQLLPALERMTTSNTPEIREGYKTVIEDQLGDITGSSSGEFDSELLRLSPREMEVCQLIQLGRSGKEMAQLLNMAFETVQTHKKNIRRKLGLRGQKISLYTYLRQKPSFL